MSDATYGELLDIGEKFLIEAALASREKLPNATAAGAAVEGHTKIVKALRANLRVFTELPSVDGEKREQVVNNAVTHLAHALDRFVESSPLEASPQMDERSEANNWSSSARTLHAAADALRTHLGPERAHRTPDAAVLDNPHARQSVVRRLAEIVLTVSEAQRRLSLRIQEKAATRPNAAALRASAMLMLESHAGLTDAAGQVIYALTRQQMPDALASLSPALLLRPTHLTNPITAAQRSFELIRLMAHRQARGEISAGIDAIRAYATTATVVLLHSHAIAKAVPVGAASAPALPPAQNRIPESDVVALRDVARSWDALAKSTERYASTRGSARLLHHEVNVLATSLATIARTHGMWRSPDEQLTDDSPASRLVRLANDAVSRLPDLAHAMTAITERLAARGELLMPTRQRDDFDHPYRWCPVNAEWAADLRASCKKVEAVTTQSLLRLPASVYNGATSDPIPGDVEQPRKPARMPAPMNLRRPAMSIAVKQPVAGLEQSR